MMRLPLCDATRAKRCLTVDDGKINGERPQEETVQVYAVDSRDLTTLARERVNAPSIGRRLPKYLHGR